MDFCISNESLRDWTQLPAPCLQAVTQRLPLPDSLAARLTCASWARAVPLPRVSFTLSVPAAAAASTAASQGPLQPVQALQLCQRLRSLLLLADLLQPGPCSSCSSSQMSKSALAGVRQVVLHVKAAAALGSTAGHNDNNNNTAAVVGAPAVDALLARLFSTAFPAASSLHIRVHKPAAPPHDCHAILLQLLASRHARQRISSLSLHCEGAWPPHEQLAGALLRLQALTRLQLLSCPVSALTRLPSLPTLQQLAVLGRCFEPCPRSYSVRMQPLLPLLPGLARLRLHSLPLNLQVQEHEGIKAATRQQQQQHPQAAAVALSGLLSAARAYNDGVTDWRSEQQYVTLSIARQCPNLQQLRSDMQLGWPLLLQRLPGLGQDHSLAVVQQEQPPVTKQPGRCCGRAACTASSAADAAGARRQPEVQCR